ncbi:hypothetical protein LEP1GSC020_4437 [Leptospira interrogans serovar Grippotyphosa str. 2006006986]|nr:hypothetical protein LEP1GSC009_1042 [Leptospira interrogans serovar Grippotyphosa str. Andaman]EKP84483.1 hypothetical protein LEP1GSC020_4437 [Leptospira interrogans serovar Grippotyphosa str. 2006006986]EMN41830.1 hypothetical protein LEP1GSC085_3189 [Leptospira interrogans str. L0996]EMO92501.1 hypothetical protein LEP1GSC109_2359 [Leptospira interrogans str. UI 13372]
MDLNFDDGRKTAKIYCTMILFILELLKNSIATINKTPQSTVSIK